MQPGAPYEVAWSDSDSRHGGSADDTDNDLGLPLEAANGPSLGVIQAPRHPGESPTGTKRLDRVARDFQSRAVVVGSA